MRTYKLGPNGIVLLDDPDAPDAQAMIAKWHPDDQAEVTAVREINELDVPTSTGFKDAWRDSGSSITVNLSTSRQIMARQIMTRLVRREMVFLDDRRVQAKIENDTTIVDQIDARKTALQTTIIPQIRDAIIAATSLTELQTVKQTYLDSRPQAIKNALLEN